MNIKKQIVILGTFISFFLSAIPAFAHSVVKPSQVGVGSFQTFTLGVPNEKENPTVAVRLVIPAELNHVSPNVKPGWSIELKKSGKDEKVTEIVWTEGTIPEGQRDEFVFSAQAPTKESTLTWKAYQTYSDGKIVTWDQDPKENIDEKEKEKMEESDQGPYSTTNVVNDIKPSPTPQGQSSSGNVPLVISIVALAIATIAFNKAKNK